LFRIALKTTHPLDLHVVVTSPWPGFTWIEVTSPLSPNLFFRVGSLVAAGFRVLISPKKKRVVFFCSHVPGPCDEGFLFFPRDFLPFLRNLSNPGTSLFLFSMNLLVTRFLPEKGVGLERRPHLRLKQDSAVNSLLILPDTWPPPLKPSQMPTKIFIN